MRSDEALNFMSQLSSKDTLHVYNAAVQAEDGAPHVTLGTVFYSNLSYSIVCPIFTDLHLNIHYVWRSCVGHTPLRPLKYIKLAGLGKKMELRVIKSEGGYCDDKACSYGTPPLSDVTTADWKLIMSYLLRHDTALDQKLPFTDAQAAQLYNDWYVRVHHKLPLMSACPRPQLVSLSHESSLTR